MNSEHFDHPELDKAAEQIRQEGIEPAAVEKAAQRVWSRIAATGAHAPVAHTIHGCKDYQDLIPAYLAGSLTPARNLLLEDHSHECVTCRKVLERTRQGKVVEFPSGGAAQWAVRPSFPWAMAAGLAICMGLASWMVYRVIGPGSVGSRAVVEAAEGVLYRVSGDTRQPLVQGQELPAGEQIRSAKESGAMIRLRDGSVVELRERSGFSVTESGNDLTLHLQYGAVLIQAAKRRVGHLFVQTRDVKVAVTGTVFGVDSGSKGSRVSVVEGEVHVTHGDLEKVLHAGEQFASAITMTPVSVAQDIAWSRNREEHVALLREFAKLNRDLVEEVHLPELRYSSRLVDLLPAETALYASIPNLSTAIGQAQEVIRRKVQESPELSRWWAEQAAAGQGTARFDEMMTRLRAVNEYLGDEIIFTAAMDANGRLQHPVFLAQLKKPGFREFVQSEWNRTAGTRPEGLHIVNSAAEAAALPASQRHGMFFLVRPEMMVFAPDGTALAHTGAILEGPGAGRFPGSPFYARIQEAYRGGAGLLLAADLERITASQSTEARRRTPPGFANLKYLVVEQKEIAGRSNTAAVLSFRGPRTGVASWLARPAAIGSLDFVSPEAGFAAGFVVKEPKAALEELFTWLAANNSGFTTQLAMVEGVLGLSILNDLAGPLGGEFTVAFDGPALPVPSWKIVAEVNDPARLEASFEKAIAAYNTMAASKGKPAVTFSQEQAGGRTYYKLVIPQFAPWNEVDYVFVDGYLLAAPSRTLLDRAIQYRTTGYTLVRSQAYQAMLPADRFANFSGMVYQNLATGIAPILETMGGSRGAAGTPLQSVIAELKATLVTVYGEEDKITVASQGSLFGLSFANLIQMGLTDMLGRNREGTRTPAPSSK